MIIVASCSFSRQIWWTILAVLGADASQVGDGTLVAWWDKWQQRWHGDKQRGADTLFALVAWKIWKERNLLSTIKHIVDLWIDAGARNLDCLIRE
ncbi:hypothetical protein BDA96_09G215700 [Sorghum bicolor]|uniref:Uncharacterized protein n=1 Tax=Sorghum bicolor TaxID=4558 RepID=A0A921QBV1_SORBI|nr:hypothetical protein BDA96_09G215700 [Sorghum bicolor]